MGVRVPFYEVRLEGEDITPWVSQVTITEDDRQADSVTLSIPDPRMIYADALFEGSAAEVDIGYAENNQHALMIRAIISKVELSYPESGGPALTLKGEDKSIMMGLAEKNKVWRDRKVSDIIREVAEPYGFAEVVVRLSPDPEVRTRNIHQDGKTDLAFLQELAQRYHAKCFVELNAEESEVLYFLPERQIVTYRRPDTLVLRYRKGPMSNLITFSPRFDSSYIDRLREISSVDRGGRRIDTQNQPPRTEEVIWPLDEARMADASSEDRARIRTLYERGAARKIGLQAQLTARRATAGNVSPDQADLESTDDVLEGRRLGMTASGTAFGNIWLRAKSNCLIEGVSQRFNREWYVPGVTHKISGRGYTTEFRLVV